MFEEALYHDNTRRACLVSYFTELQNTNERQVEVGQDNSTNAIKMLKIFTTGTKAQIILDIW